MTALNYLHGKADNAEMFYAKYLISKDGKLMHLFWAMVLVELIVNEQYTEKFDHLPKV